LPGASVTFVGERVGEVRSDTGNLGLTVDATFEQLADPDVIVVPGGPGTRVPSMGSSRFTTGFVPHTPPLASQPRSAPVRWC